MNEMRCPSCGSTDVACVNTAHIHSHRCNDCGRVDVFRRTGPASEARP